MLIVYGALFQILVILIIQKIYWVSAIYLLLLYLCWRKNGLKKTFIIQMIIIIFGLTIHIPTQPLPSTLTGTVIEVGDYHYVIKTKLGKIRVVSPNVVVDKGNKIKVEVEMDELATPSNFNAFNYKQYCFSQKIFYQVKEVAIFENNQHLSLLRKIEKKIESFQDERVVSMSKQLLLGIKDEAMVDLMEAGKSLSILHLFALSGMHLTILKNILERMRIRKQSILLLILGAYVLLLGSIVSLWRAYLMLLFRYIFKDKFNDLEILAMISILFCLYNPFVIYSLSYIFSFTVYAFIIITKGNKHAKVYPYLSGIPIILMTQFSLNPLSYAFIWLFSGIIEIVYGGVLINALSLNLFGGILSFLLSQFERVIYFLEYTSIELIFMKPNFIFICFYYGILLLSIYHEQLQFPIYKDFTKLALLLICLYVYPWLQPYSKVVMIDVGQGDCFLIMRPFNQGNYLIDTGGNKNYDLATKSIIPYLKSQGIRKLDTLIITHDDFDHAGAKESLIANFKVERIISQAEDVDILKSLPIQADLSDSNAKSLVYTMELNGLHYLFTGDLPIEGETQILTHYPNLKIDILKVGHHGSSTSTASALLAHYKMKYALISVGKNNMYHHPNSEVIKRLNAYDIQVYRSDTMGMVEIVSLFSIHRINYCRKT